MFSAPVFGARLIMPGSSQLVPPDSTGQVRTTVPCCSVAMGGGGLARDKTKGKCLKQVGLFPN